MAPAVSGAHMRVSLLCATVSQHARVSFIRRLLVTASQGWPNWTGAGTEGTSATHLQCSRHAEKGGMSGVTVRLTHCWLRGVSSGERQAEGRAHMYWCRVGHVSKATVVRC